MSAIWTSNGKYTLYSFQSEAEFERLVIKHIKEIFSDSVCYYDIKQKLKSKTQGTIPDGYMIDYTTPDEPIFYIVEFELARHPSVGHIGKQLMSFELAYETSKDTLRKLLVDETYSNKEFQGELDKIAKLTNQKSIDSLIDDLIQKHSILVVIDEIDDDLSKAIDLLRADIKIVQFSAYQRENERGLNRDYAISFTDLYSEKATFTERGIETHYRFYYDLVSTPNTDKNEFLKWHHIGRIQGYVFIKDEVGENKVIVFQGYKNRIDADLARGEHWWGTGRPVRAESLQKGMKLYVMETNIDGDTRIRVDNPKVRIEGTVTEVWLMRGNEKIKKIFPVNTG